MPSYKLIHLIQYHSDNLAADLTRKVRISGRAESYRNLSPGELKERVYEIYHHLGAWLLDKGEPDIEQRYSMIGARRADQDVPLSELVWVMVSTKHNLWEFIGDMSVPGRAVDTADKQELLQLLDRFFDQAIYAAVVGYERATKKRRGTCQVPAKITHKVRKAS
jgi:hypothetical protein